MSPKFLLHFCFFTSLFTSLSLFATTAQQDDDPIVVRLTTESSLKPLYLSSIINDEAEFSITYLKQLEQILSFDLNHNGTTSVVKRTNASDELIASVPYDQFGNISDWKSQHIFYVVKPRIKGHSLFVNILNVNDQSGKSMNEIPLSGNLTEDRRQIHKLADAIHKALFGTEGIASSKILYTIKTTVNGKPVSEVYETDYDGANTRQLTHNGEYCVTPAYLPPKPGYMTGGFMYVSYVIGQPKIYMASFKGGAPQRLSKVKGNQLMPTFSLQRDKVAFICDVTGNPDLFIQPFSLEGGPTGKPYQVFSAKQATQGSPSFSPDGKRLAFVSNKDGAARIYVIDIPKAGTSLKDIKATLISKRNRENSAPCWSPDGNKIAFCARSGGDRQIWVYDFTTNQERQITQGAGNKENPSWAPNSLHLVFNSADTNASELFFINLNQSDSTQITSGKGEKRFPAWEPKIK